MMARTATLTSRLEAYIAMRRTLGYDLTTSELVLRKFAEYADASGHDHVTTALFLSWKDRYGLANNGTWAARLAIVRGFAQWLQMRDDRNEVPPAGLIPGRRVRPKPYIYTPDELRLLVSEARRIRSPYGLRGILYATMFGLIATTGLRLSEALRLERMDVDLGSGLLHVRRTKNGYHRVIPLRPCGVERLAGYAAERNRLTKAKSLSFFLQENELPATAHSAHYNFAQVSQKIGLREPQRYYRQGVGPRIHDLRHTFAVHTILDWFREGRDIDREMYRLSTYLGHADPKGTYWYIEAVPELLQLAAERAEAAYRRNAT